MLTYSIRQSAYIVHIHAGNMSHKAIAAVYNTSYDNHLYIKLTHELYCAYDSEDAIRLSIAVQDAAYLRCAGQGDNSLVRAIYRELWRNCPDAIALVDAFLMKFHPLPYTAR